MANKYALLIGTSDYDDERLARLKTPAADLNVLARLLGDPEIGGYQVKLLLNQPFMTELKEIVSFLKDRHRDDHLLLYFSGHGILDEGGNLYLATKDTERDLLSATALSNKFIKDEMDKSRSKRQVLILDCCHSGAFLKGTKGSSPALTQATFEGYGRAVITAADSIQYALEGDQVDEGLELSLFTHFLAEGIQTGDADRGNDGWIELDEWFDYAFRKVRDHTDKQTPRKFVDNQYGELYIARNPKASVVKPAELPERLRARMKSEYKPDRLEAIQELQGLLEGDDPSMVMAAQIALEKISVDDDSLSIRNSAAGLLAQFAERQAVQKAEEEHRAQEQAEAERLAALRAEEERQRQQKAEAERLEVLKAEEKRLARERVEAERQAALKATEEHKRAEAERQAALKAETERQAEQERLARQEAEAKRKEEDERQAHQRAEQEQQAHVMPTAEQMAPQAVDAGGMAGELASLELPALEKVETQWPGARELIDRLPRWAIWVGLVLVGGLIVGLIASRQANRAGGVSPTAVQEAMVTIAPTMDLVANATPAQPLATLPGVVIPVSMPSLEPTTTSSGFAPLTDTPPPPVSTVEPTEAAAQLPETTGRIAFVSERDGNSEIYVMNADGSGLTRLTNNSAWDSYPAWSPDGRRIAFVSDIDGNREIYVMNADGSGLSRVTGDSARYPIYLAWSPDGARIAFNSGEDANEEIYVVNVDGSGLRRLTNNYRSDNSPAWSPDGTRIAFVSAVVGFWGDIYVMNADGSDLTRLTNNSVPDTDPTWLPDGSRIAFDSGLDGPNEINVMNADGSGLTQLADEDGWSFVWSPDYTRIAFVSERDGNTEIYVMNADGSGVTRLTNNSWDDYSPAWSLDSTHIAFESFRDDGRYEIYVMNADGSGQTRLTDNLGDDRYPAWQP